MQSRVGQRDNRVGQGDNRVGQYRNGLELPGLFSVSVVWGADFL